MCGAGPAECGSADFLSDGRGKVGIRHESGDLRSPRVIGEVRGKLGAEDIIGEGRLALVEIGRREQERPLLTVGKLDETDRAGLLGWKAVVRRVPLRGGDPGLLAAGGGGVCSDGRRDDIAVWIVSIGLLDEERVAGLGDLITTATSAGSHHHELGRKLARGKTEDISGEGIHTLAMVEKYRLFDTSPYPLYGLVHDVVQEPFDAAQKFRDYLLRVQ